MAGTSLLRTSNIYPGSRSYVESMASAPFILLLQKYVTMLWPGSYSPGISKREKLKLVPTCTAGQPLRFLTMTDSGKMIPIMPSHLNFPTIC